MSNILLNPSSGILEFNTGAASGSAFDQSMSGAARFQFQNSGELNLTSYGTGVADKFTIDGSNGRLFSVDNTLTGEIFSVNDAAGLPILGVESTSEFDKVTIGEYGTDALVVSGSAVSFANLPTISGNSFITGFSEGDDLQAVTDRGDTTTTSILSTGPHISGVTGLFSEKVGIGTTAPSGLLHVTGVGAANTTNYGIISDLDGGSSATNIAAYFSASSSSVNYALQTVDGKVDFGGNITAAGTIDARSLHSSTLGNIYVGDSTSTYAAGNGGDIVFAGGYVGQGRASTAFANIRGIKENGTYGNTLGALVFGTQTGVNLKTLASVTEKMRITSDGNVGIGTDSPSYALDVYGTGVRLGSKNGTAWIFENAWEGLIKFANYDVFGVVPTVDGNVTLKGSRNLMMNGQLNVSSSNFYIELSDDVGYVEFYNYRGVEWNINSYYNEKFIINYNSGTAPSPVYSPAFVIAGRSESGYVGIGTSTPAYRLDVYGDVGGTGAGDRITLGGTPYLLSGDAAAALTLQDVCDNDNTTTTSILSTGPHISGVTGLFSHAVGVGTGDPTGVFEIVTSDEGARNTNEDALVLTRRAAGSYPYYPFGNSILFRGETYRTNSIAATYLPHARIKTQLRDHSLSTEGVDMSFELMETDTDAAPTERMRITSTGYVGIGTIAPAAKLEINTDEDWSAGWRNNLKLESIYYPSMRFHATNVDKTAVIGNNNDGGLWFSVNGAGDAWGLYGMVIKPDRTVGIGTDTPAYKLHVNSTTTDEVARFQSTDRDAYISIEDDTTTGYLGVDGNFDVLSLGLDTDMASASNLNITRDGKVGIGNNNPSYALDVAGSIRATTSLELSATSEIDWHNGNSKIVGGLDGTYSLSFQTYGDGLATRMVVTSGGYVGVGLTNPAHTLHVSGSVAGTGVGDRITLNGTPYLLSGDSPAETQTLQDVCNNGNTTTGSMSVEGQYLSGVTGIFTEKVGIGVAAPAYALHVDGAIYAQQSSYSNLQFQLIGGKYWTLKQGNKAGTNSDLLFYRAQDATTSMVIKSGGNVGIGTASPAYHLEVTGKVNADTFIQEGNNGSEFYAASFARSSSALTSPDIYDKNSNGIVIGGTSSEATLVVEAGGNVGIGTTNPAERLEVSGNIRISDGNSLKLYSSNNTYNGSIYKDSYNATIDIGNQTNIKVDSVLEVDSAGGDIELGVGSYSDSRVAIWPRLANRFAVYAGVTDDNGISGAGFGFFNQGSAGKMLAIVPHSMGATAGAFKFQTMSGSSVIEAARFSTDGKLGIGTTDPEGHLQIWRDNTTVNGEANRDFYIRNDSSVGDAMIGLATSASSFGLGIDSSNTSFNISEHNNDLATQPRLVIKAGGNVGIGTATPASLLHVWTPQGTQATTRYTQNNWRTWTVGMLEETSTFSIADSATTKCFQIHYQAPANGMWLGASGVGIQNTDPEYALDVSGSVAGTGVGNRITLNGTPYLLSGDSPAETQTLQDVCNNGNTTTGSILSTGPHISGVTGLFSDKVGIGTDSPTQKLDVDGNIQGGTIYSNLFSVANEGKVVSTATAGLLLQATAGSKPITFYTNVGGNTERMRIAADGSVGIGIDDPEENLEVSGNVVIGQSTDGLTTDTSWLSLDGYYEHGLVIKGYGNWTQWRVSSKVNGNLEIYNTGASDLDQQVYIGHTEAVRDANVFVWTTGSVLSAGRNSETYPILDLGIQDAAHGYNGDAYIDVRTSTTPPSRFHFKKDGEFIASGVSVTGTVAGTGAGGRITLNGTPYLLSGDSPAETQTLQDVCNNGNTTTGSILSTGPHISGVTGLFSDKVGIGTDNPVYGLDVRDTIYSAVAAATINLTLGDLSNGKTSAISTNNDNLIFYHDGSTESMRITNAGHVGIGTVAPNGAIEIESSVIAEPVAVINSNYAGSQAGQLLFRHGRTENALSNNDSLGAILFQGFSSAGGLQNFASIQSSATDVTAGSVDGIIYFTTYVDGSNAERMRIHSNGNVGIGTDSPLAPLDVNGNIYSNGNLLVDKIYTRAGSSDLNLQARSSYGVNISQMGGSSIAYFDYDTTNVGIGTTAPAQKLHVAGITRFSNAASNYIEVDGSVSGANIARISSRFNRFEIVTNAGAGDPDICLLPASGGNVGIGNNSPAYPLSVSSAAYAVDNYIDLQVSNTKNAGILFRDPAGGRASITANTDNDLVFATNGTGSSSETMRILDDGNVGIGTTAPQAPLHVVGGGDGQAMGGKSISLTTGFTDGIAVTLGNDQGCYVKATIFGDWSSHSTIAYLGEFFIQNGGDGYMEPGMIIRQVDNTHASDGVEAQIEDSATDTFNIQFKLNQSVGATSTTAYLNYHVMGQFDSIS